MPQIKMFGSGSMKGVQLLEGKFYGFVTRDFKPSWFDREAPREWAVKESVRTSLARWLVTNVRSTERVASDNSEALLVEFVNLEGKTLTIIWDFSSFTQHANTNTAQEYRYWFWEANAILRIERGARVTRVQVRDAVWVRPPERI